ncbi:MAG: hypothetical protein EBV19_07100, partial [Flavobacteriia bacterium]|nr:hypothetical protein [Flavobacteriia bacterium]
ITPYGVVSFGLAYRQCIENPVDFCRFLTQGDQDLNDACAHFLETPSLHKVCPFAVNTSNINCDPQDPNFFDLLGLLGTFSLSNTQAVIVSGTIPMHELDLLYWSCNIYIADRVNPYDRCRPYRDIIFGSILPPCNAWNCGIGILDKASTCKRQGYLTFYIIASIHPDTGDYAEMTIRKYDSDVDVIWRFNIPTAPETFPLFKDIPNPNMKNMLDPLYNSETDRLAFLFRFNNIDDHDDKFKSFIEKPGFQTYLIDVRNTIAINIQRAYDITPFPSFLPPAIDESTSYKITNQLQLFKKTCRSFNGMYNISPILWNESLINVMAPLSQDVHNGRFTYESGIQALQLAGNALGDNHDTWYKSTNNICLTEDDVIVTFAVNHNYFSNSIFCSLNVIATANQMGYASVTMTDGKDDYYILITGRHGPTIEKITAQLQNKTSFPIHKIFIKTGAHIDWKVPPTSPIALCERAYINPMLPGDVDIRKDRIDPDQWMQVTGPNGRQLVTPVSFLFRPKKGNMFKKTCIVIISVSVIIFYMYVW